MALCVGCCFCFFVFLAASRKYQLLLTIHRAYANYAWIKMVDDATKAAEDAEAHFKTEVEKLQKKYEKLSKEKDEAVAAAATKELRVVKQVLGHMKSGGAAKDEL